MLLRGRLRDTGTPQLCIARNHVCQAHGPVLKVRLQDRSYPDNKTDE